MSAVLNHTMGDVHFTVGTVACVADRRGGLFLPDSRTLLVADLHLEKGSSLARRRVLAPPYDTRATLAVLGAMIAQWTPQRVIALGDNFHDDEGSSRLLPDDSDALAALQRGRDWIWLSGNHDPSPPAGIGGDVLPFVMLDDVLLWHAADGRDPRPQMAGHLHPCARVATRGRTLRRKCFVTDGTRLIMPAIGAYTGGLNILDRAFDGLFQRQKVTAYVLGDSRIFSISPPLLMRDRA
ncbi:MAG: ligase-associated DNA damage response endonuclease PdeM [Beijerinckiaceae bacterium]